jgi:hypothetical protein
MRAARLIPHAIVVVTVALGALAIAEAPSGAGFQGSLRVDAVVNGTPTGSLELTRTCTPGNFPSSGPSAPFTASGTVFAAAGLPIGQVTCTITATQTGGLVPSFHCELQPNSTGIACSGDAAATSVGGDDQGGLAVITVTFDAPPAEPIAAAAPLTG